MNTKKFFQINIKLIEHRIKRLSNLPDPSLQDFVKIGKEAIELFEKLDPGTYLAEIKKAALPKKLRLAQDMATQEIEAYEKYVEFLKLEEKLRKANH